MIDRIRRWIRNKINIIVVRAFAKTLVHWMQDNREATMTDLNDWLEKNGWQCIGIAMDGSKVVYENYAGAQIDINLKVENEED